MQVAAEVRQRLYCTVQTCILTLLCSARPHPVGTQRDAVHTLCQMSPYEVCERFCYREDRACLWVSEGSLWSMSERSGNTLGACIVESHNAAVRERQLQFTLTLLTCYAASHRTVHLVGEPVLTSHSLQLQHLLQVFCQFCIECCLLTEGRSIVCHYIIFTFNGLVLHDSLWRRAEHLVNRQVERSYAVSLFEGKAMVACCLTDGVHRSTLAVSNLLHMFYGSFVDEQSHTLL